MLPLYFKLVHFFLFKKNFLLFFFVNKMKNVPFFENIRSETRYIFIILCAMSWGTTGLNYCSILYTRLYVIRSTLLCIYTFESQNHSEIINFPYFSCYTYLNVCYINAACNVDIARNGLTFLHIIFTLSLEVGKSESEELMVFKQYCKFVHRSCS